VAINIAEETVEALRTFSQVTADPDPDVDAFNDIVSGTQTVSRGGLDYTLTSTVTDYYYDPDTGGFQTNKPDPDLVNADVKRLELTVAWGVGQNFQVDETTATAGGTGSITLVDLISSPTTSTGAKVLLNAGLCCSARRLQPGQNPDIVSIQLATTSQKESTTRCRTSGTNR
jgi:hypothetical protein